MQLHLTRREQRISAAKMLATLRRIAEAEGGLENADADEDEDEEEDWDEGEGGGGNRSKNTARLQSVDGVSVDLDRRVLGRMVSNSCTPPVLVRFITPTHSALFLRAAFR